MPDYLHLSAEGYGIWGKAIRGRMFDPRITREAVLAAIYARDNWRRVIWSPQHDALGDGH